MLRARAAEQVRAGPPGAHLQQLEAEHVLEREPCEGAFLAQHARAQRAFEPFRRRIVARSLATVAPS